MLEAYSTLKGLAADGLLQPIVTAVIGTLAAIFAFITILTNRWSTRMRATFDLLERLETTEYNQVRYRTFRKIR